MMQFGPIGLLHPGEMGAAVGGVLAGAHPVWWASSGRSPASARRASAVGLTDVGSVEAIRSGCELIISICPPEAARDVAVQVSGYFRASISTRTPLLPRRLARWRRSSRQAAAAMWTAESSAALRPLVRRGTRLYLSGADGRRISSSSLDL